MRKQFKTLATFLVMVISIGIVISPASLAEVATSLEMRQVCRNWLSYIVFCGKGWSETTEPRIAAFQDIVVNDTVVGHYFEIEPSGYVIVPILKDLAPVEAYSDMYHLDWNDKDGVPVLLKDVLNHRVRLFVEKYGSTEAVPSDKEVALFGDVNRTRWDRFLLPDDEFLAGLTQKDASEFRDAGPLLTSVWHQYEPYNNYCPTGDGGRTLVGCVATSASQIMDYYEWPPEGIGSHDYWWAGDYSCEGSSPGAVLSAFYNDPYDWGNIPDDCYGGCTMAEEDALAELCYEVGVAYNMDYGYCGSGAYTSNTQYIFPMYFRYLDQIELHNRGSVSQQTWSDLIQAEIEAGRVIHYQIYKHAIVCDGWRDLDGILQVHMNYGWGGSQNLWYTIDQLHCDWEGCDYMNELMLTRIEPDKRAIVDADTTWGQAPLEVQFTGNSSLPDVSDWTWVFGDGDSAFIQSPIHTYTAPGRYDVSLSVLAGSGYGYYATTDYMTILADSLIGPGCEGASGTVVEVVIYGCNTLPVNNIKITVEYAGTLSLNFQSYSTDGCRIDYFDVISQIHLDTWNKRMAFNIYNTNPETPDLEAGGGPMLKLYFSIPGSAEPGQSTPIELDGYQQHMPLFSGPVMDFAPVPVSGDVFIPVDYICGDANGDTDINLLDVLFLIAHLYDDPPGPAPDPPEAGDVNGDGAINLLDVLYLIDYLYGTPQGPEPVCP
ncbi:MAG: C10 family peptidase [Candidatus Zixiibacteriota bacterium]|nr:MAG: C10 family peptidase [candidate division Zixibacteria bacterium]